METHPLQDLLSFGLGGEEFRYLHVPAEDRIRQRRWRLLGSMNHDLDLARSNLPDDLPDPREVRVKQERLPHRLVVDRRVREADLERPQVALADREPAADRPEPLRDPFHVIPKGQVVCQESLQTSLEGLVVDPKQVVHEGLDVELAGVGDEFVQDPVGVRPPEPDEVLASEELLDQVAEGDVHDFAEGRMDDEETIERLNEDPVVRGDRGAGLAVVRVLLDEAPRAGLVDRPGLLEMGDGLRNAALPHPAVDLLPDPADALREAERHGEHLAVPPRDQGVRVGDRGDVDHAVLPDPFDLPGPASDDEVQALPDLDHHELLAEDPDLLLRTAIHDLIAPLFADRRETLDGLTAALRLEADLG